MQARLTPLFFLNLAGLALVYALWRVIAPGLDYIPGQGLAITNGQDFLNYWGAPQIAAERIETLFAGRGYEEALHRLYHQEFDELRWSYPLHSLFFYAPFSHLPYLHALLLWSALGVTAFVASTLWALPPDRRTGAAALLLFAPITLLELLVRQNGFFTGAGAMAALWLLKRKRPALAGIMLGCMTIKPQLFLLWPIALVAARQWRAIAAAAVTAFLLVGLSLIVHGIDAWLLYVEIVPKLQWELTSAENFEEGRKLFHLMMPGVTPALRLLHAPQMLVTVAQAIVSLGTALACWRVFRHHRPTLGQSALILSAGGMLCSPYGFNYDLTFLTAALVLRWSERKRLSLPTALAEGLAYLTPLLTYLFNLGGIAVAPPILLAVFLAAMRDIRNESDDTAEKSVTPR